MNRILLSLAFLSCTLAASSQKVYFIYIQSEAGQPFYVKMNEKVLSSNASGYLILSKLRDTVHSFAVGLPGNKLPEQLFSVSIDKKDHGYLFKNLGDKGWALFDLQTLAILMPSQKLPAKESTAKAENKDASDFTDILSKAADDPSLKEKPEKQIAEEQKPEKAPPAITKAEEVSKAPDNAEQKEKPVKPEPDNSKTVTQIQKTDKPLEEVAKQDATAKEELKNNIPAVQPKDTGIVKAEFAPTSPNQDNKITKEPEIVSQISENEKPVEYKASVITRRSESSTTEGFGLTFIDLNSDGVSDTIKILIPNSKPVVAPAVSEKPELKEEKKFLETGNSDTSVLKTDKTTEAVGQVSSQSMKNNCPSAADENDFLRIRKKMAAETSDDNMITEARKIFKTKCFTTMQIKNLSLLFLNDKGKYEFFDSAYPYVSDVGNFASLESEIKDSYYVNRFKAMLRL